MGKEQSKLRGNAPSTPSAPAPAVPSVQYCNSDTFVPYYVPGNAIEEPDPMPKIENENITGWKFRYMVSLVDGCQYHFNASSVGSFSITGGSCGSFTVAVTYSYHHKAVQIHNEENLPVFMVDGRYDKLVTIQDNPATEGGSLVILFALGEHTTPRPIPIRAVPNEVISLTGNRDFVICGSGAELEYDGTGSVTVNGDLRRLKHEGSGTVVVHGDLGRLKHEGSGTVLVNGKVNGKVNVSAISYQSGYESVFKVGTVTIDGDVGGELVQKAGGLVQVKGEVKGGVHQTGTAQLFVKNGTLKWCRHNKCFQEVNANEEKKLEPEGGSRDTSQITVGAVSVEEDDEGEGCDGPSSAKKPRLPPKASSDEDKREESGAAGVQHSDGHLPTAPMIGSADNGIANEEPGSVQASSVNNNDTTAPRNPESNQDKE